MTGFAPSGSSFVRFYTVLIDVGAGSCPSGFVFTSRNLENDNVGESIHHGVSSSAACGNTCSDLSDCQGFEYDPERNMCKTKERPSGKR